MGAIKPIETKWNGYVFRSRLEARWAIFFDALGVEWEYEPEGFELPSGRRYLPDFRVKCWGDRGCYDGSEMYDLYIEVKGMMTQYDAERIKEFSGEDNENKVLVVGNIPPFHCEFDSDGTKAYEPMDGIDIHQFNYETIDGDCFAAYPAAHKGRFYLMGDDSSYINTEDVLDAYVAYAKARKARFEFDDEWEGEVNAV